MATVEDLARLIYGELKACGYRWMVGVPDIETSALWKLYAEDRDAKVVTACREGEAVGICAGMDLAGRKALLCIKNFGLFESLDTFRALPVDLGIPMLMFIGYAGRPRAGAADEAKARLGAAYTQLALAGQWTEAILKTISVPHYVIEKPEDVTYVRHAAKQAQDESRPVALLGELPLR